MLVYNEFLGEGVKFLLVQLITRPLRLPNRPWEGNEVIG